jgi:hypothetical protein
VNIYWNGSDTIERINEPTGVQALLAKQTPKVGALGEACTPERLMHSSEQTYCIQCDSKACRNKPMLTLSS